MGCKIVGHGKAQPELVVSNDDLANIVDTSDEWIVERTGIHNRRIAVDESTTDLGVQAAQAALENAGVVAGDIDLIVCMTISGDVIVPSQAALIKAQLGANNAIAFDLNAACSGCIYGIDVASTMIEASVASEGGSGIGHKRNAMRRALVVGAERLSRITDWTDRATCVLFGDGAGAVVLEWDESAPGILASFLKNTDDDTLCLTVDANHDMSTFPFGENVGNVGVGEIMDIETDEGGFAEHAAFIRMHGQRVFKFATAAIVEAARERLVGRGELQRAATGTRPHHPLCRQEAGRSLRALAGLHRRSGQHECVERAHGAFRCLRGGPHPAGRQGDVRGLWRRTHEWRAAVRGVRGARRKIGNGNRGFSVMENSDFR